MPRKRNIACKEGFKRKTTVKIHFRAFLSVDKLLANRQIHKSFLKLFLFVRWYVCMFVCVSAPEGINNQWHDMV